MPFWLHDLSTARPALVSGIVHAWQEHRDVLKDMGFSNRECNRIEDAESGYSLVWGDSSERVNCYGRNIPGDLLRIKLPDWKDRQGKSQIPEIYRGDIAECPKVNNFLSIVNAYGIYSVYFINGLLGHTGIQSVGSREWNRTGGTNGKPPYNTKIPLQIPNLFLWGYIRGFGKGDYSNFDSGYPAFTESGTLLSDLEYIRHAQNDRYTSIPSDFALANAASSSGADSLCFWLAGHSSGDAIAWISTLGFGPPGRPWVEFPESLPFGAAEFDVSKTPWGWPQDDREAFYIECWKHADAIHEFINAGMPCLWTEWKNYVPSDIQQSEAENEFSNIQNDIAHEPTCKISNNPPTNPKSGDLWLNKQQGKLKAFYKDDRTQYWIDAN